MGERPRRRVRDLVTQPAFEGLSENEIGRARISMMARSDLLHARAGYRSARPVAATLKIQFCSETSPCRPFLQLVARTQAVEVGMVRCVAALTEHPIELRRRRRRL